MVPEVTSLTASTLSLEEEVPVSVDADAAENVDYSEELLLPNPLPSIVQPHLYPTALYPPTPVYHVWEDPKYALPPLPHHIQAYTSYTQHQQFTAYSNTYSPNTPGPNGVAHPGAIHGAQPGQYSSNGYPYHLQQNAQQHPNFKPNGSMPPPGAFFSTPSFRPSALLNLTRKNRLFYREGTASSENPSSPQPYKPSGQQVIHLKDGVYQATYSNSTVYELVANGVGVMRRHSDGWVNATHVLKAAGIEKGRRTKILEKKMEYTPHEKVQGGYGKYQGTWMPPESAREVAAAHDIEHLLLPIFEIKIPNLDQ